MHVLEGARRHGVSRVVSAASSAAYGNDETLPKRESQSWYEGGAHTQGKQCVPLAGHQQAQNGAVLDNFGNVLDNFGIIWAQFGNTNPHKKPILSL